MSPAHIPAPSGAEDYPQKLNSGRNPGQLSIPAVPHADYRIPVTLRCLFTGPTGP